MTQRQYFCPHCDDTFALGASLQAHVEDNHPMGDDHSVPDDMRHFLGSAVECGYDD